jgi:hypothetical protein
LACGDSMFESSKQNSFIIQTNVMKNFKFTGVNIAAALLIIAFFFPWFSAMGSMSVSGFSIITTGISPGMLGMFLKGLDRLLMVLIIIIPVSAGIILYQNVSGNKKFEKYYRPAHFIPAVVLIVGLVMIYFKIKPDVPDFGGEDFEGYNRSMRSLSRSVRDMSPGLFDVLGFGVYASLAAAIYLLLTAMGKIKDKEYYKPAAPTENKTDSNTAA